MPGKAVFGRYIIFNRASIVYCKVTTSRNQWQVENDDDHETDLQVRHDDSVGDLIYG